MPHSRQCAGPDLPRSHLHMMKKLERAGRDFFRVASDGAEALRGDEPDDPVLHSKKPPSRSKSS